MVNKIEEQLSAEIKSVEDLIFNALKAKEGGEKRVKEQRELLNKISKKTGYMGECLIEAQIFSTNHLFSLSAKKKSAFKSTL